MKGRCKFRVINKKPARFNKWKLIIIKSIYKSADLKKKFFFYKKYILFIKIKLEKK